MCFVRAIKVVSDWVYVCWSWSERGLMDGIPPLGTGGTVAVSWTLGGGDTGTLLVGCELDDVTASSGLTDEWQHTQRAKRMMSLTVA